MATTPGLRPLGLGEILDVGIKLCVRHWRTLALCVVWLVIPVQVLGVLVLLSAAPDALDPTVDRPLQDEQTNLLVAQGIVYVLQGIVYAISTAACFKAVADAYLGAEPSARRSLSFGARRLPKLIGLGLVVLACYVAVVGVIALLVVVAPALGVLVVLALIVPFVWVAISWSLSAAALLFEDAGPVKALSRSFELVKGRWFKVAGTLFVGLFLVTLVAGVLQGILIFVPALAANGNQVVLAFATVVAGTIGSVLTTPFTAAVIALIYFDQRVRKEGFDLELLAAGLGEPAPTGEAPAIALRRREITPEQRAQAPFWPPPPGWTPPTDPAQEPAREEPAPDAPAQPPGGWQPPRPPSWPPESPERGSGGL